MAKNRILASARPRGARLLLPVFLASISASQLGAREPRVDEVDAIAELRPGKVALATSEKGMKFFALVPRSYDERDGARLIVFLHGSNMNGHQYLETIDSQRWCRDDILICPNGESGSGEPFGANNYTFESAPLVAEIVESFQGHFNVTQTYIGGHSQGAFVTYSAIMLHPELYDGAFPIAGDCWMQNEPNLWESKPEQMAKQKEIALAVIHGQADPVVNFSQGEHAHGVFLAMGYPKLRFFAPEKLGHQFALSPVEEALQWLDAMTGRDPAEAMRQARDWFREGQWGWVYQAALAVVEADSADLSAGGAAKNAIAAVEKKAAEGVVAMRESMGSKSPEEWISGWWDFQQKYGATEAAAELVADYWERRAEERQRGAKLFQTARGHAREGRDAEREAALKQILNEAPHTYHAWYALQWLKD